MNKIIGRYMSALFISSKNA